MNTSLPKLLATPTPGARSRRLFALTSAACSLLLGTPAFGQGYEANDITPIGLTSSKLTGAAGGEQVGGSLVSLYYPHAFRHSDNALTAIDLNPAGFYSSMALCTDGSQQGAGAPPRWVAHTPWCGAMTLAWT